MSLKPITEIDGLDNKSLNLYANTITANTINGEGSVDFKDIECETITVSGQSEFNGNVQLSGPTTLFDGSTTNIASDSVTINSPITFVTGNDLRVSSNLTGDTLKSSVENLNPLLSTGSNITYYNSRVTIVGKNVNVNGFVTADMTSKSIILDLDFPTGTTSDNIGEGVQGLAQINAGRVGGGAWSTVACQENIGKIRLTLYSVNDAAIVAGQNTFVGLYYNINFENKI